MADKSWQILLNKYNGKMNTCVWVYVITITSFNEILTNFSIFDKAYAK